jgi:hypothetical protein
MKSALSKISKPIISDRFLFLTSAEKDTNRKKENELGSGSLQDDDSLRALARSSILAHGIILC